MVSRLKKNGMSKKAKQILSLLKSYRKKRPEDLADALAALAALILKEEFKADE